MKYDLLRCSTFGVMRFNILSQYIPIFIPCVDEDAISMNLILGSWKFESW